MPNPIPEDKANSNCIFIIFLVDKYNGNCYYNSSLFAGIAILPYQKPQTKENIVKKWFLILTIAIALFASVNSVLAKPIFCYGSAYYYVSGLPIVNTVLTCEQLGWTCKTDASGSFTMYMKSVSPPAGTYTLITNTGLSASFYYDGINATNCGKLLFIAR